MSDIEQRLREAMDGVEEGLRLAEVGEYLYNECAYSYGDGRTEPREYGIEWQWQQAKPDEYGQGKLLAASTKWHAEQAADGIGTEATKLRDTIAALRKQVSDAVGALEEAAGTLEGLSYIHDGNPSDAMADIEQRLRAIDEVAMYEAPATTEAIIREAADELAVERAKNASLRSKLEEAEGARDRLAKTIAAYLQAVGREPVAVRELHGPYGWLNGHRALSEDSWELENDPLENSDEYFAIPLYALTDPFAEIGKDGPRSALVATPPAAMTCDEQFALATKLAGDLGYDLVPEPPHPDTPVDNFSGQTTPPAEPVVSVQQAALVLYHAFPSAEALPGNVRYHASEGHFFSALRLLIDPKANLSAALATKPAVKDDETVVALPPTREYVDRIVRIFRDRPADDTSAVVLQDYARAALAAKDGRS